MKRFISIWIIISFIFSTVITPQKVYAQEQFGLPTPGTMVYLSPSFVPSHLAGMTVHPQDPFNFDFFVDRGDGRLTHRQQIKEYGMLIKYFLASLTIPDEDQWVNLSPYEKDRMIKDDFSKTQMGHDLLGQDYLLKEITSSMIFPESRLGSKFWDRVYEQLWNKYHTTQVPINTFNKVWIIPDQAAVYESGDTVYILRNHLKVMLEQDYLSLEKHTAIAHTRRGVRPFSIEAYSSVGYKIIREVILPELEKEVNEGRNFANLRQIYSGMILATWYKNVLKKSLLARVYADQGKLKGIDQNPRNNETIYKSYLQAFKKGVFNFIKEDHDRFTDTNIPRKYFSGGMETFNRIIIPQGQPVDHFTDAAVLVLGPQDYALIAANMRQNFIEPDEGNMDKVEVKLTVLNPPLDRHGPQQLLLKFEEQRQEPVSDIFREWVQLEFPKIKVDGDKVISQKEINGFLGMQKYGEILDAFEKLKNKHRADPGIRKALDEFQKSKLRVKISLLLWPKTPIVLPATPNNVINLADHSFPLISPKDQSPAPINIVKKRLGIKDLVGISAISAIILLSFGFSASNMIKANTIHSNIEMASLQKMPKLNQKYGIYFGYGKNYTNDILASAGLSRENSQGVQIIFPGNWDLGNGHYLALIMGRDIDSYWYTPTQSVMSLAKLVREMGLVGPGASDKEVEKFVNDRVIPNLKRNSGNFKNIKPSDEIEVPSDLFFNLTGPEADHVAKNAPGKLYRAHTGKLVPKDSAQLSFTKGGIDLNSKNLKIERNGQGIELPIAEDMAQLSLIQGIAPVILSIKPVEKLPISNELKNLRSVPLNMTRIN